MAKNRKKKSQNQSITMKIPHAVDISALDSFRKEQSKVYRLAYNMAHRGLDELTMRHELKNLNVELDSWLTQSAIKKAIGQYTADIELDAVNGTNKAGTRIFGGKRNFYDRLNGKISSDEYRKNRMENFRSIGEAQYRGNRKASFNTDSVTIKPARGIAIAIEIPLPNLRGKYLKNYTRLVELTTSKSIPVTVELNERFLYLSFDANQLNDTNPVKKVIPGRYLGIDLNPNYIGVSFFNEHKDVIDTRLYDLKSLTGKDANPDKLKHEVREIAIQVGKMARHYQLEYLFVEELRFDQGDKGKGRYYNRLTSNQFLYREFIRMLAKYGKVIEVNAAYTSTIGNILHHEYPDPVASSMEVARRGIESRVVKGSRAFYPPMVERSVLLNRWKEEVVPELNTWVELHGWLKTGVKYRVPIPERGMFRRFNSNHSGVFVL